MNEPERYFGWSPFPKRGSWQRKRVGSFRFRLWLAIQRRRGRRSDGVRGE